MSDKKYILAINPGSTSTKIAIYEDKQRIYDKGFSYESEQLKVFPDIKSQKDFRLKDILDYLKEIDFKVEKLSAVVGRGGVVGPLKSGAYLVNDLLIDRLENRPVSQHASNLGGVLASEIAKIAGVDAFVYDGVTVDELIDVARVTGIKGFGRYSRCHALNMRATAMKVAEKLGKPYKDLNIIVAHLGGGITMSMHEHGRMIDVILDSEGPLSPERAGRLPVATFLSYLSKNNIAAKDAIKIVRGGGGLVSLLGTNSGLEVEKRRESGDKEAKLVMDTIVYQAGKGIGELSTTVCGKVDAIAITGSLAYSKYLTSNIEQRVKFIAPVEIFPGENELESLSLGVLRVLNKEEKANIYDAEVDTLKPDLY